MIFGTSNDNLFQQKPRSLSISDDDTLLSLLRQPLPSSDDVQVSQLEHSSADCQKKMISFYEPFDDPDLEPLPIGPPSSISNLPLHVLSKSSVLEGGFKPNPQEAFKSDLLSERLYSLLFSSSHSNTTNTSMRSKRTFDDDTPFHSKRQRTIPRSTSDETVVRFRPYQEKQWNGMYRKLVLYKHKHGHSCVPHSYKDDPMLARWVKRQRYQRTKFEGNDPTSTMTANRIRQLDSIGFVWHSHASAWQTKFNELKAFKHRSGHCDVPSNYPENAPLSTWVRSQRRHYQLWKSGCQSTMTPQRHEQLQSLGFSFANPTKSVAKTVEEI